MCYSTHPIITVLKLLMKYLKQYFQVFIKILILQLK